MTEGLTKGQIWLHRAGWTILVGGLVVSAWAYAAAATRPLPPAIIPAIQDSKLTEYQIQLYGGKIYVLGAEFQTWFAGLWHGRELGITLAVLSLGLGGGLLFLADFLPHVPPFPSADYEKHPNER
jgi:hypothetical protein